MFWRKGKLVLATSLVAALFMARPASAQAHSDPETNTPSSRGAMCLLAGHSFFAPVARSFDEIAQSGDFPGHRAVTVFAPGQRGTPRGLWENEGTRKQIETQLATGRVELFGMPAAPSNRSGIENYKRWIDLALEHNPDTRIFIGQPWAPGGPRMDAQRYATAVAQWGANAFELIEQLRRAYPDTQIEFLNYGLVVSELKTGFEAGEVPDLTESVGRGTNALFRDRMMGHGGPMVHELAAAVWISALYQADIESLSLNDYETDVRTILKQVLESNERYRADGGNGG